MNKAIVTVALAVLFTLGACGSEAAAPEEPTAPASVEDETLARIKAAPTCKVAQEEFDVAYRNTKVDGASSVEVRYMKAADARLKELRCY